MKPASRILNVMALSAAVFSASCAKPPPPPPLPVAVVPPAAPPPPPVAMPRSVLEQASAYRTYVSRAAAITPAFADGASVQQALMSSAALEPKQLLRGAIAYAALVAMQSPQFVAGVRTYAVDPTGRRELAQKLLADPNYAQVLPSAASAAGLISATLAADGTRVRRVGDLVKQAAYDVQKQKWATGDIVGRDARLAQAKTLSAVEITPPPEDVALLATAVNGRDAAGVSVLGVGGEAMSPPYTGVINRALAVAALASLGEATPENEAAILTMMDDTSSSFCLNMAKLMLFQCLAVAKPYYEDVFCLGVHSLQDTAQCITKTAGSPPAATLAIAMPPGASAVVSTAPPQ